SNEVGAKDSYQNEYSSAIKYFLFSYSDGCYVEYLLNKEYERFSTIITPSERWTSGKMVKISIIGDDVVLYEVTITRETHPITVDLDVAGVEIMRIEFEKEYYYSAEHILFVSPSVYKKF
ncbi:MAG: NPCBM/NEW2 domain-containing protein, partial [Agathobacter sp.]|nr:NPCBM/NEW2 domain-containing protein [Agathobacter sp.]